MEFKSKFFSELTTTELYEILRARSEVLIIRFVTPENQLEAFSNQRLNEEQL